MAEGTKIFEQHIAKENHKPWLHQTPCGTSKEDAAKFMAIKPAATEHERSVNIKRGYLSLVGGVMFAMVFTRPDINFHASRCAKFMKDPSNSAYEAIINVVHYLYATRQLGITYGPMRNDEPDYDGTRPRAWGDGSFGGRDESSPQLGGYIEYNFGPLLWKSQANELKPLSTCEQEVAAVVLMCKEGMFVMGLAEDFGLDLKDVLEVFTDSQSARDSVVNQGATKNSIHYERRLFYARELFLRRKIRITLVKTDMMRADDKTKVVHKAKFIYCRKMQMNLADEVV